MRRTDPQDAFTKEAAESQGRIKKSLSLGEAKALTGNCDGIRLLSKAEVCDRVGRTFPTIWIWMRQGRFPRARDLEGRPVWLEREVDEFCLRLPNRVYIGDPGYQPNRFKSVT